MSYTSRKPRPLNPLASASGPYLRSAAHQPMNWCPWVEGAFAEAQR